MDSIFVTRQELRESRGWLATLGVVLAVLGIVAILASFAATVATVLLFAVLLLVAGVAQIGRAFSDRDDDVAWHVGFGILYLVAGGMLAADPVSGAVGLTLLMAGFFLFLGVVRLSLARRVKRIHGGAGVFTVTGVLDLLLGVLILVGWPEVAGWVIGLFVGIELLSAGICLVALSRAVARREPEHAQP